MNKKYKYFIGIVVLILLVGLLLIFIKVKSFPNDKEMDNQMIHSMDAMIAHAGNENSVDVMMYNFEFKKEKINENLYNLIFIIKNSMSGEMVSDLDIVHDKIMHVVLVRKDLKYFDHIHPQQIDGKFIVPYSFYSPGDYRIWIDFTVDGMQYIIDFDTSVKDVKEVSEPDKLDKLNVEMDLEKEKFSDNYEIEFTITDSNNNPVHITEKFLAANAHMIVVDEILDEFGHAHDENFDKDNVLSFEYKFKNKGIHKMWVQFSVNENVIIKEFEVEV